METRPLFGGAIRCAVPPSMRDQSLLIPVPDHQEVFLDHNTGECLIVEIVEHQPGSPQDVCRVYVEDMGQLNEATSVRDVVCETLEGLEAMPALREQATGPPQGACSRAGRLPGVDVLLHDGPPQGWDRGRDSDTGRAAASACSGRGGQPQTSPFRWF
jgi:hypothetical protein